MQFCPVNKEDYEKLYRLIIEETKKDPTDASISSLIILLINN